MPNSYQESSSFLPIPRDKLAEAQEIIGRVVEELENGEDGCCGCQADIEGLSDPDHCGVWFHGTELINVCHVEAIARELIEELGLDEPFFCSWALTCSRPLIDQFGGGAFVIKRGYETYWCDALEHVRQQLESGGLIAMTKKERENKDRDFPHT